MFDELRKQFEEMHQDEVDQGLWDEKEEKNSPTEIIIKPEALDTSKLDSGEGVTASYRPLDFSEYVGQDFAKKRVECYIDGTKKFDEVFPHTFLSAPAGHGKTVFANILANMLGKKIVITTGGELKNEQAVVDKIVECEGGILLIDEAHRISQKVGTFMLPILEEFLVSGQRIKPFSCFMATTHKGNMAEHLGALLQRFQLDIELNHYNEIELVQILKQFHKKSYGNIAISDRIFGLVAKNCRFTPRVALTLLKEFAYVEDWDVVMKNNKIVKDGLNEMDLKILLYLYEHGGVGKNTLAKYLKVEPKTYEFQLEPFLIFKELVSVGSRRIITPKGIKLLEELK
jgi:Holliday junction DNA helicase RuvB